MLTSADMPRLRELCGANEFFWLDLNDPDTETVRQVGQLLNLHPLALEDTQEFGQRPKVDVYEKQLLLVFYGAAADDDLPVPIEVHLHVSASFILSVHRQACRRFDEMRQTLVQRPPRSEHDLVFRVIDALTDSILDVLDRVADHVDAHESEVFHRPRARDRDHVAVLKRSLGSLRRVVVVQCQQFERTTEQINALPGLASDANTYWRDVGDHLGRAMDEIEAARDSCRECSRPTRTRCRGD